MRWPPKTQVFVVDDKVQAGQSSSGDEYYLLDVSRTVDAFPIQSVIIVDCRNDLKLALLTSLVLLHM